MKRKITEQLVAWKNMPGHKPLILQGARQVGKSYILEEFGKEYYKTCVRVSLDLVPEVRNFLKNNINPQEIIAYLESLYNIRIVPHETLIILDEIQDCKRALLALKYFQEEYPQYDIVAAGSLLGVAVNRGEMMKPCPIRCIAWLWIYTRNISSWEECRNQYGNMQRPTVISSAVQYNKPY